MSSVLTDKLVAENAKRPQGAVFPSYPENAMERKILRSTRPVANVAFEFTQDAGLLHQYCVLRGAMFASVWDLKSFSGERDRYDDISHVMIARRGLQVLAGGRLTLSTPSAPQPLPMESADFKLMDCFPYLELEKHCYGEFSRLAILPEFRAGHVFPDLAQRFIRRAVAEGVDYAFNMAPVPLARSYRQTMLSFGLDWRISEVVVPDREEFEGIKMVLSVMDLRHLRASKPLKNVQEVAFSE
jgi:hypothetical protein